MSDTFGNNQFMVIPPFDHTKPDQTIDLSAFASAMPLPVAGAVTNDLNSVETGVPSERKQTMRREKRVIGID